MIVDVEYTVKLKSGRWRVEFDLTRDRIRIRNPNGMISRQMSLGNCHQDASVAVRLATEEEGRTE